MTKHDFSRVCWNCGRKTMQPRDSYYQCAKCGATWNHVPKLAPACVTQETYTFFVGKRPMRITGYRPRKKARE